MSIISCRDLLISDLRLCANFLPDNDKNISGEERQSRQKSREKAGSTGMRQYKLLGSRNHK